MVLRLPMVLVRARLSVLAMPKAKVTQKAKEMLKQPVLINQQRQSAPAVGITQAVYASPPTGSLAQRIIIAGATTTPTGNARTER